MQTLSPILACRDGEFTCVSNGQCIPETFKCNRRDDCEDGSDEENCRKYSLFLS